MTPFVKVKWKKGLIGEHVPLKYEGPINQESSVEFKKNGMDNDEYFPERPDPVQCFFAFLPITFFDKVAEWTQKKLKQKKVAGFKEANIKRDDILGLIVL